MKLIPFNTEMVRAILDNRKTSIRRVIKPQPKTSIDRIDKNGLGKSIDPVWTYPPRAKWNSDVFLSCSDLKNVWKPHYCRGDILYVRETWDNQPVTPGGHFRQGGVWYYKADGDLRPESWRGKWHPSIHMPREAARIFLQVTDVRVEKLQDITDEEAEKEGCNDYTSTACGFADVWNSTIKPKDLAIYGWDANPWVWVIEFKRISREEAENASRY